MTLSTDIRIRGQYAAVIPGGVSAAPAGSFSQALSAASQAGGGTAYESYFQMAADACQVPVDLLKAMAKVESNFSSSAVSSCGAQGIMQLMPATARSLGVTDSFDPAQNIMGGAKYLRQMLDCFGGNVPMAVAAYNAGPGAVKKYGGVPPYQETQNYVKKVLAYADSGVSVPAPSAVEPAVTPAAADRGAPSAVSLALTRDELADLILRAYRSGGNQESVRQLLRQLFSRDEEEEDPISI